MSSAIEEESYYEEEEEEVRLLNMHALNMLLVLPIDSNQGVSLFHEVTICLELLL